jgi:beta-galactosidase
VDGKPVKQVLLSGNPLPTTLEVQADSSELIAGEKDAVRFIVRALDQHGRVLPFLDDVVSLQVSGGAKLLGPAALAFKGGVAGFWVESTGERRDSVVTVSTQRLGLHTTTLTTC